MAFKDRLKEARQSKGYTQEQLADQIGVAKTTLTGYEKGNREPNMATISNMIRALDIDANYLWQDETTFPFELTYDEMEHLVKKYRDLDIHGKEMVDFALLKEWERSTQLLKETENRDAKGEQIVELPSQMLNAAHARTDIEIPEGVDTSEDDIMDDENF